MAFESREYTRRVGDIEVTLINPPREGSGSYRDVVVMCGAWAEMAKRTHGEGVKRVKVEWDVDGNLLEHETAIFDADGVLAKGGEKSEKQLEAAGFGSDLHQQD